MVTCRMMIRLKIRFVLMICKIINTASGGADDPPPMPKLDDSLNMS